MRWSSGYSDQIWISGVRIGRLTDDTTLMLDQQEPKSGFPNTLTCRAVGRNLCGQGSKRPVTTGEITAIDVLQGTPMVALTDCWDWYRSEFNASQTKSDNVVLVPLLKSSPRLYLVEVFECVDVAQPCSRMHQY